MTAREERELFLELCSSLKAEPPDSERLEQIVKQWQDFQFDTDFDEFARASKILHKSALQKFALDSEKMQELVNQVSALGFLTQYTGSVVSELHPEPDRRPTCLEALYTCLQPWSGKLTGTKGPFAEAWHLLARHASTVRAALDAEDEEMLLTLFRWNGSGAVLDGWDQKLSAEARACMAQKDARRGEWQREINCGRVPDELGLSSIHAELVAAASVKHSAAVPFIVDTELLAWVQNFEECVLKNRTNIISCKMPNFLHNFQNMLLFGSGTWFIIDFSGHLPEDDGVWDILTGKYLEQNGNYGLVRIGGNTIEVRTNFRRYLISETPDVHLPQQVEGHIVCIGLRRQVLQILRVGVDDGNGRVTLSCVSVGGTEVARLNLISSATSLAELGAAVASESGLETCKWEFVFKAVTLTGYKFVSARNLPQSTLVSNLL